MIKKINLKTVFIRFRFFIKIHLVESSKLEFLDLEMLSLPHALSCVFLYLTSTDTVWHTCLVLVCPPPLHTHTYTNIFFFKFRFSFVKNH